MAWEKRQWGDFITSIEAGKNWNAEGRPPQDGEFGVVKVSSVTWGEFDEQESKTCTLADQWNEKVRIHKGDFLFSRANTLQLVGNCVIVQDIQKRLMLSDKILRFNFDDSVVPEYILYFTRSDLYRSQVEQLASGNQNGMRNISQKNIRMIEFPLPPLAEQQRIVDTIEGLFAELDEARENLLSVLELLEARRKTILHEAFAGALTAKWREEHGVALESWTQSKLMEVGTLQTGLMKGKRYGSAKTVIMPYLRVANVQDGFLKLDEVKEIEVAADSVERYMLRQGDVLFTEGGDFDKLGRGTVWNDEIPNCLHQNHVFAVRTDHSRLLPAFLALQAASKYGKDYFLSCSKQTTNLASINSTQLKNFPVLMPTIEEQTEIVRILDSFFDEERQVKEAAEAALEKIGQMKKSILDDAFRGLLGTNDPTKESAAGLLSETP